jgi:hypothetical protein
MKSVLLHAAVCFLGSLSVFSTISRADVIYSNAGTPLGCPVSTTATYNCGSGEALTNSLAFEFQVPGGDPANEVLSEVDFAASTNDGITINSASATASLYSDAGGHPGSALAGSGAFTPLVQFGSDEAELSWTPGASGPDLSPGSLYWIVISGIDPSGEVFWNDNTTGVSGYSELLGGSTWTAEPNGTLGFLQIEGTTAAGPAPEPGTLLMLVAGLALFALCYLPRSRKRRLASGDSSCG